MRAAEVAPRLGRLRFRRLHRAGGERLEHVLDDVLRREALDQLRLLQAHRRLMSDGAEQLRVLVVERAPPSDATEEAQLLVSGRQRRDHELVLDGSGAAAPHERHQLGGASRAVGRVRAHEVELVGLGVDPPDLARVRAEQLARAARDRVVEVLAQRDRRQRLAQLGERGERLHPPARALVELRVLDRARGERRRVHEKVEHSVVELARSLGMENHHTQDVAVAGHHRHGHHRLEALLLELRHVLHARVVERVVADELRRLRPRDPTRQALVHPPGELADQMRVARRRRSQHQAFTVHEVDECRRGTRSRRSRSRRFRPSTRSRSSEDETVLMTA